MSRLHSVTTALAVLVLAAPLGARLSAQSASPVADVQSAAPAVAAPATPVVTAPMAPAPVAVRAHANVDVPAPDPFPARTSHSTALMIVGGAAIVVGAVVGGRGGTVIMVGGAVIGIIGLWEYLQ